MENFKNQDPYETELQGRLKKLEILNPQAYDYAMSLAKLSDDSEKDSFFEGIEILNQKNQPAAEGLYEEVHFRTAGRQRLTAKLFENGRLEFGGYWD